jgi:hypothetical protein
MRSTQRQQDLERNEMRCKQFIAKVFFVLFICEGTERQAVAVEGPKDAMALTATAFVLWVTVYSLWNFYYQNDESLVMNRIAKLQGYSDWANWYMNFLIPIAAVSGLLTAAMISKFCTGIGIDVIDRHLCLNKIQQ